MRNTLIALLTVLLVFAFVNTERTASLTRGIPLAPQLYAALAKSSNPSDGMPVAEWVAQREAEQARIAAEKAAQRAKREEARLRAKQRAQAKRTTKGSKTQWSTARIKRVLRDACGKYGITGKNADWLVETGARIAYRESTNRPGARSKTGKYVGLMQFSPGWGSEAQRADPYWALSRFVKVYADGGKSKIKQHWRATY